MQSTIHEYSSKTGMSIKTIIMFALGGKTTPQQTKKVDVIYHKFVTDSVLPEAIEKYCQRRLSHDHHH